MYLHQFEILQAKNRVDQDRTLDWIAHMHGSAEQKKTKLK